MKSATRERLHSALRKLPPAPERAYLDLGGDSFYVTRTSLPPAWFITQLSGQSFTEALVDFGGGEELTTMAVTRWVVSGPLVLRKNLAVAVRPDADRAPDPVELPPPPRRGLLKQVLWARRTRILDVTDEEIRGLAAMLSRAVTMAELKRRHGA